MIHIDQLIRTRRKTIALIVTHDGKLVVRAPLRASRAQVDAVVAEKSAWIRSRQVEMAAHPRPTARQFIEGEHFLYLGETYPLHIAAQPGRGLELRHGRFELGAQAMSAARTAFAAWYRRKAREVLAERIRLHAARLGLTPGSLRISSARTRWGSCSSRGTLSFTWRLVLAPTAVIDYVVVHELIHLAVKNHSPAFWQRVAAAYPAFQDAKRWLREHSGLGEELGGV